MRTAGKRERCVCVSVLLIILYSRKPLRNYTFANANFSWFKFPFLSNFICYTYKNFPTKLNSKSCPQKFPAVQYCSHQIYLFHTLLLVLTYIERCCLSKLTINDEILEVWQFLINDNLPHTVESIRVSGREWSNLPDWF